MFEPFKFYCIVIVRVDAFIGLFSGFDCSVYLNNYRISSIIRREFFSFQNNPKDLDPSCKMDLDLWDCLGMGKIGIIARFHRTDLVT